MSSCPGARGSTVSTSKVGAGLVVEEGGAVVGGAVVLVEGTVVVVTVETGNVVVAGAIVEVAAMEATPVLEDTVTATVCTVAVG